MRLLIHFMIICCLAAAVGCQQKALKPGTHNFSGEFERIKYNNPNASADLGVGLWAWPLPMDYDDDGDYDLLVSCKDVPFNGIYFFENKSGEAFPIFETPVRIGVGLKDIQISYVDGQPRFLQPGKELIDFSTSFEAKSKDLYPGDAFKKLHNKIRFNQWKYVDYENDGDLDIVVGIQDGEDYGWDNAFNENGVWVNGPLHGLVYLIENINGSYELKDKIMAGSKPFSSSIKASGKTPLLNHLE